MDIYQLLTQLCVVPFEGLGILMIYTFLIDKKEFIRSNKITTFTYILFYTFCAFWITLYIPTEIHFIFTTSITILILSFITKSNLFTSTISIALITILITITDSLTILPTILLFHIDMNVILTTPKLRLVNTTISIFLILCIAFYINKSKLRSFKWIIFKSDNSHLSYAILQVVIVTLLIVTVNYAPFSSISTGTYNFILFSTLLILLALNFLDYKEREKMLRLQHKHQLQDEYVKNLETMLTVVRREKHDFMNHLNTLFAISVAKTPDSLEKIEAYIRKLTENYQTPFQFYNTGNDYINGLLAMKSSVAVENEIDLKVSIDEPLSNLKIDDSDLTSIIGNIVDNAIEAVRSNPEGKKKSVCLWTYVQDDKFCISVSNTGPVIEPKNLAKIFDQGFSTKSNDRREHGYGLYITRQLVTRNGGAISVTSEEEETEFVMEFGP